METASAVFDRRTADIPAALGTSGLDHSPRMTWPKPRWSSDLCLPRDRVPFAEDVLLPNPAARCAVRSCAPYR